MSKGIDKDRFVSVSQKGFERFREERERESRQREEERQQETEQKAPPKPTFKAKPAERVTVDLAAEYVEIDKDLDGQIGLYEWVQAQRGSVQDFYALDVNYDGFVTPKEIVNFKKNPTTVAASGSPESAPTTGSRPSSGSVRSPTPTRTTTVAAKPAEPKQERSRQAEYYFKLMDRNKDERITEDEWGRSRRLKPRLEQAGVDLSSPMDIDQFNDIYVKYVARS